ncbi:transposase [Sphingobacterium sp. UT-1RO-CII-1]|uniref:transposase n=1 Tax=Sphingobacterium sp. UT-1RO-CII-1 TaxID=2995225 RepID=UPI00227D6894|nr:transposase [Sphingobacterium sp. UT-1RO-CII-1]MCY4779465.1 transposase [Sphingobacterium sp. UT-1RO-CII-1]
MKKIIYTSLATAAIIFSSCQNNEKQSEDPKLLSQKAIEIHDEIMPQISTFNKHTVLIDSILDNLALIKQQTPDLDTTSSRHDLSNLKANLETATDKMMVWMKEYSMDNTDVSYQEAEIQRISDLKNEFDTVNQEATKALSPFNK